MLIESLGLRRAIQYTKGWAIAFPYRLSSYKKRLIYFYYETIARVAAAANIRVIEIFAVDRIGHLLMECDTTIKQSALGQIPSRRWVVLHQNNLANPAVPCIFGRRITFIGGLLGKHLSPLSRHRLLIHPTSHYVLAMNKTALCYEVNSQWGNRKTIARLPPRWQASGQNALEDLGIPPHAAFVCMHARDGVYSPKDESYHSLRNHGFSDYRDTIEFLYLKGIYSIFMGHPGMANAPSQPGLIDYAHHPCRAGWMDLYLAANCLIFVGGSSGAYIMASIFDRPVVCVNMCLPFNFSPTGSSNQIGIPKLFRRRSTGELVRFDEILSNGAADARNSPDFLEGGDYADYELINNTPTEIKEVVEECMLRQDGHWEETAEDHALQQSMHKQLRPGNYSYGTASRCGALFLRKYRSLL
ncbi:MAG: TIGR04372 family glycosyltransferase [Cyanobacteria bacterium]|nr:TIGR04372 family glycosyltransferase [Cyanobacteriota bacterium]